MKGLFALISIATLSYSGWWAYAAQSLKSDVANWFVEQQEKGWVAEYEEISVRGFPSRTDLTLTAPTLVSPDGSYGWQAPFLQILGLTYRKGHVIVAWPDSQSLTTPNGTVEVTSTGLRASVIHDGPTIIRQNFEADVLNLTGPEQTIALAGVNTALEKIEPSPASYRFAVSLDQLAMTNQRVSGTLVPETVAALRADTNIVFNAPVTLDEVHSAPPHVTEIALQNSQLTYGAFTLRASGDGTVDAQGRLSGEVTLEAENWRDSLQTARDAADIPAELVDGIAELFSLFASLNGSRDTLDVTLGFNRGTVLLGPLPIGEIPALPTR